MDIDTEKYARMFGILGVGILDLTRFIIKKVRSK